MSSPTSSSNPTLESAPSTQSSRLLNVIVVDDTNLFRTIMVDALSSLNQVSVVGKAVNGTECLDLLAKLPEVDVVFLDIEMPVMNGLETLRVIRQRFPTLLVVMVSGHNKTNVDITIEALSLGAYDFISKPEGASCGASLEQLRKQLFVLTRSIAWQRSQEALRIRQQAMDKTGTARTNQVSADFPAASTLETPMKPLKNNDAPPTVAGDSGSVSVNNFEIKGVTSVASTASMANAISVGSIIKEPAVAKRMQPTKTPQSNEVKPLITPKAITNKIAQPSAVTAPVIASKLVADANGQNSDTVAIPKVKRLPVPPKVLLIGISTGGPAALMQFIPKLPSNLGLPVLVVQHMPPKFTQSLADSLNSNTSLTVKEGEQGEVLKPNVVYIAPGGFHMEVETSPKGEAVLNINQKPAINSCRPSVDVLLKSIPAVFGHQTVSVIMTGMGRDGCEGIRYLKQMGGTYCITQSKESCVVYGMPKAIDDQGLNDESVPLSQLAARLGALLGK
jgi:two-component system chemotaxis response regulator CheB